MKPWLNVGEGAEYAGLSRDTIYTACERKELRHARARGSRTAGRGQDVRSARPKPRTDFSRIFQDPTEPHFADGKTPPRPPLQVTEKSRDGELVPVRGFAKGWIVKFCGIAA